MHLKSFTRKLRLLTIIFPLIALAGCWGNGSGPSSTNDSRPPLPPPPPLRDSAVDGGFEPSDETGMPNAVNGNSGGCGAGNLGAWPYFNCNFVTSTLGPSSAPVSHDVPGTQSLIQFGIDAGAENSIVALEGDKVEVTVYAMSWEPDPFNNLAIVVLSFWDQPGGRTGGGNELGTVERTAGSGVVGDFDFTLLPQDGAELSDWTEITFSATAPPGTMSAQVLLIHILLDTTPNTGAIYWDDLSLKSFGGDAVDPEPEPDYQLIWFDEFDLDGEPSPNNWTMETGYGDNDSGWGNDEWQFYTDLPENVRVESGNLVIDALCEEDDPVDPEPRAPLVDGGFEPPGTDDASAADQACLGGVLAGSAWDCFNNNFVTANDGPNSGPVSHDPGGNQSLKQFGVDGDATNTIEAAEGDTVDLSAWAMNWVGDPFKNFALLQLTFWDGPNGSGNRVGNLIEAYADAGGLNPNATDLSVVQDGADVSDWTEMSLSAVAPAGTQSAQVLLRHINFGSGGGSIYWDDVSLIATPPVVPSVCGGKRDGSITSARINTSGKFDFKFGKVEARIQVPVGTGASLAFWMLGANFPDVGWPFSGEVDIMEVFSKGSDEFTTSFAMHWCDEDKQTDPAVCFPQDQGWTFVASKKSLFPESLGDDFHVYSAVWDEDRIVGKIDGQTYFTQAIAVDTMDEFLKEFFLILNVAIGGTLGGAPDATTPWPQRMLVDWVRVYQEVP